MRSRYRLPLLTVLALNATACLATINVTVDGQPVAFRGPGPQFVSGRVLVPLRGVMEKLGAFVGWDPATQTVTADRSDHEVQLVIGSQSARIDDRAVNLDVPARIYNGSTLVPLRFMSEALGAHIDWIEATSTVSIVTAPPPRPVSPHVVASLKMMSGRVLKGGSRIHFELDGQPHGQATIEIPGVSPRQPMTEEQPGRYLADCQVWGGGTPITVTNATAIARLTSRGTTQVFQSSNAVTVDTQAPIIDDLLPEPNTRIGNANSIVSANLDDGAGTGIEVSSARLAIDGVDVSAAASVSEVGFTYQPLVPFGEGLHRVTFSVRDRAGNLSQSGWSFTVAPRSRVIRDFVHSPAESAIPGQVISFRLEGEPGGVATCWVGRQIRDLTLAETSPGVYQGSYTVRLGDHFYDEQAVARLKTRSGDSYTAVAAGRIGGEVKLVAPRFEWPRPNERVGSTMVVKGWSTSRATVQIVVSYSTDVFGPVRVSGPVATVSVRADSSGHFQSGPLDLSTFLGGHTTYTVVAITMGRLPSQHSSEVRLEVRN